MTYHCRNCKSENITFVEFQGGFDGWSMKACNECGACYDRWSDERIVDILNGYEKYGQPTFLLESGAYSWKSEIRKNPLHKNRKLKWIKFYSYLKEDDEKENN